ncbi:MAG: type III-A CRISPR-associated RAMP protein Csm3 [Microscillaceae bacterium]|jgi:CRISPR-associated protein Csm3|nr:type III-A CRISPR-associated RAMP protein Csm3 [Microscillaceae bacterium]
MTETANKLQLKKKIILNGEIKALTGLLIGGTNTALGVGGPDKMVIRNPLTNQPYIPGSSLKGKMRSLLEVSYGYIKYNKMGKVEWIGSDDIKYITTQLFGNSPGNATQRPSRIIFRDGGLVNIDYLESKPTDLPFTETKTEVVIDRITSAAMPRTFERVPAGAIFSLNIVLNVFDDEHLKSEAKVQKAFGEKELLEHLFKGLQMIQDDYLGGAGSRGSGQVSFKITEIKERTRNYYQGNEIETPIDIKNYGVPNDLLEF